MPTTVSVKATHNSKRVYANIRRAIYVGSEAAAEEVREQAMLLTSGQITRQQLSAMGHPFGRSAPLSTARGRMRNLGPMRGSLPRLPINIQSGKLQASLRVFNRSTGGEIRYQIQFTAPHAKYILAPGGTRRMVARGFWTELRKRTNRILARNIQQATMQATAGLPAT